MSYSKETWMYITLEDLTGYQVSSLGRIRKINTKSNEYEIVTTFESNGYRILETIGQNNECQKYELDKLVALAFLPLPQGIESIRNYAGLNAMPYYVIHKNFINMDSRPENLEWRPSVDNLYFLQEASGVRPAFQILLKDHFILNERLFNSSDELAAYLGVELDGIYDLVKSHHRHLYRNRYTFEFITPGSIEPIISRRPATEVLCKDYVSGEITIYTSLAKASLATGVNRDIIRIKINSNQNRVVNSLLAGYDFFGMDNVTLRNPPKWPEFTREEAIRSRNNFFNVSGQNRTSSKEVEVYDIHLGTVTRYNSLKTAVRDNNENYFVVFDYVLGKKKADRYMKIFGNKIYRLMGDLRCWNEAVELRSDTPGNDAYFSSDRTYNSVAGRYLSHTV